MFVGENYKNGIGTKEIVQKIRDYVKKYSDYTFSITLDKCGWTPDIKVSLVSGNKDITKDDNLIILPIGLKLPLNPIEYLKQEYKLAQDDFVSHVIQNIKELNAANIQESIVVGFDIFTASVKKATNADIVAAIDSGAAVKITKNVRVTNDPNAPVMRIEPDIPPLTNADLRMKLKERNPEIKFGTQFNSIIRELKKNPALCRERLLNPKKKDSTKTWFYTEDAVDFVLEKYKV